MTATGGDSAPLVVGITGASGAIYGVRLLERLAAAGVEVHLVASAWGQRTLKHELGMSIKDLRDLAAATYTNADQSALISSGSFRTRGMVIAPTSAKTLAAIATGLGDNLVNRAADVTLKERRRLVLLVRETPLHEVHLRNMLTVTRMGAVVMPPVPAFYSAPASIDDVVDHTVMRVMDLMGVPLEGCGPGAGGRWDGNLRQRPEDGIDA